MSLKDKILNMRFNEFGLAKQTFLGKPDKDTFPNAIEVVKWVDTEPIRTYSVNQKRYVERTSYCYVIGTLEWDEHEPGWEFKSIGLRYLEDATPELNEWLISFCKKYEVIEGEIHEREEQMFD